jgi:hypothetical protein
VSQKKTQDSTALDDPMKISDLPKEMQQKEATEDMSRREEVGGFRVPKGTDDEQKRYKTAVSAQTIAAKVEPVESLMERYGLEKDPYLAGLYKSYLSAPSSEIKEAYGDIIRRNVDPTIADRFIHGSKGDVLRMAQAIDEKTDDLKSKVLPSTVEN